MSGWWRAGQCLGGINLVKVAATAWPGLGWAGLGWWWIEWIPSGGAGPACAGGGSIHLAGGGGGGHVTTTQAGYADIYTYLHTTYPQSTQCIHLQYLHLSTECLHCSIFR